MKHRKLPTGFREGMQEMQEMQEMSDFNFFTKQKA